MKENKVLPNTIIDNQEIRRLTDSDIDVNTDNIKIENTRELILKSVKKENDTLVPLMLDILAEVESNKESK